MKDRQNIMRNVLWWADELCARVAVKCSPKVFLGEKHSCFAPETATWDEYFVTGRGPPSRATGKRTLVDDVLVYEPLLDDGSKFENLTTIVTNLRSDLEYPNREDADNEGMMTGIDGYKKARELASRNETFVWRFEVSFWNSNLYTQKFLKQPREQVLSHRDYTDNCPKIDFYPTRHHLHFARIVLDFLNITKVDQYATMHLRRGDYRKCNTEPDEVIRYLNCSLGDVIASPQKRLSTLLIFTNGDSGYKHNLTKNLEEHFSSSLRCIVVDDLIKTDALLAKLDDEASDGEGLPQNMPSRLADDNCYSWQALKVIISLSKIHLERGHMSCQTCDVGGVDPTKTVV